MISVLTTETMEMNLLEQNLTDSLKFEQKVLRLISLNEKRKASNLIEKYVDEKKIISDTTILKFILEPSGMTVAHKLAFRGDKIEDKEILFLKGDNRSKENSLYGHNGCSVAFIMAKKGHSFTDKDILKLGSEDNKSSVAHAMAAHGFKISNIDILKLEDDKGTTVAHIMATKGHRFNDPEILNLKNHYGFTVRDFQSHQAQSLSVNI